MFKKTKKILKRNYVLILSLAFLLLFAGTVQLFAAAPIGGYGPGDTLDPNCAPGDPDCIVNPGINFTIDTNDNMFAGTGTGTSLTTGTNNFFVGLGAGQANEDGGFNLALGFQALYTNTSGGGNIALGYQTLYSNTVGTANVAIGNLALYSNISGGNNLALGNFALTDNTIGSENVAVGGMALSNNSTGSSNVSVGFGSLSQNDTGNFNISIGQNSLYTNVAGSSSVAVGYNAMRYANSSATPFDTQNTAVGYESLMGSAVAANNIGYANTALGFQTLSDNISGVGNVAVGYQSLLVNEDGSVNVAVGAGTLMDNISGEGNVAVGSSVLTHNTSGDGNVAIGGGAMVSNITGNNNIAIGTNANVIEGLTNATAIGYNASVGASNSLVLGGTVGVGSAVNVGIGTMTPTYRFSVVDTGTTGVIGEFTNSDGTCTLDPGDIGGWSCPSDQNLKKDISDLELGLLELNQLRPVTYRMLNEDESEMLTMGLIAQEVEPIFPKLVRTQKDGTLSLNYGGLTPVMIKAIQELDLKVEDIYNLNAQNSWTDRLITWLGNTANGIEDFFANRIRTKEICILDDSGETCITKNQLDQLLTTVGTFPSGSDSEIGDIETGGENGTEDVITGDLGDGSGDGAETGGDSGLEGGTSGDSDSGSTGGDGEGFVPTENSDVGVI